MYAISFSFTDFLWLLGRDLVFYFLPAVFALVVALWRGDTFIQGLGILFGGLILSSVWVVIHITLNYPDRAITDGIVIYGGFLVVVYVVGYLLRQTIRHSRTV